MELRYEEQTLVFRLVFVNWWKTSYWWDLAASWMALEVSKIKIYMNG
jgi:hypothetical protein